MTSNSSDEAYVSGVLFHTLNGQTVTSLNLLFYLLQTMLAGCILFLNGLVLDTMVRQKKWREPTDLLVAGLAVTDMLLGVFVLWVTVYTLVYFQCPYECLARLGLAHAAMLTGMLHLLLLTTDRFLKIVTPFRYPQFCHKWTVWVAMGTAWLLGGTVGALPLSGWHKTGEEREEDEPVCSFFAIMDSDFLRLFMVLNQTCMGVIIVLYLKLFLVARKHAAAITASLPGERTGQGTSGHAWRYTKTVLLIVGLNYFSWMPMGLVVILSITGALNSMSSRRKGDLMLYTSTLVYCNSLLNPIIYALKIPAIRHRYRALFCRCKRTRADNCDTHARQTTADVFSVHTVRRL